MKPKKTFYTEIAYVIAMLLLALGAALMEKADFGLSMVVAPAYILHLKISQFLPWFTFGVAEYTLQAVLLILMVVILRTFKIPYLFSFVTAVLYGTVLDGCILVAALLPLGGFVGRIVYFVVGVLLGSIGVSLFFKSYISPEVYELLVKEVAGKFHFNIHKVKTVYDCASCFLAIVLSFSFFGLWHFEGVSVGTILCALCNGYLISRVSAFLEAHFTFRDKFPLRKKFEL